ncbi:MAG: hypothetical protein LBG81_00665 [Coriobacteriaceae bacterium]|nr:hypothetical protein [Coriobacteriaceae bacterium]
MSLIDDDWGSAYQEETEHQTQPERVLSGALIDSKTEFIIRSIKTYLGHSQIIRAMGGLLIAPAILAITLVLDGYLWSWIAMCCIAVVRIIGEEPRIGIVGSILVVGFWYWFFSRPLGYWWKQHLCLSVMVFDGNMFAIARPERAINRELFASGNKAGL